MCDLARSDRDWVGEQQHFAKVEANENKYLLQICFFLPVLPSSKGLTVAEKHDGFVSAWLQGRLEVNELGFDGPNMLVLCF